MILIDQFHFDDLHLFEKSEIDILRFFNPMVDHNYLYIFMLKMHNFHLQIK